MKTKLNPCLTESDISQIYKDGVSKFFKGCVIVSPHKTDGVLICEPSGLRMLLEFKFNKDFTKRKDIITVLIQCLYYLKKFEVAGEKLPNIIFVGDRNELFYMHTNTLVKYLEFNLDWLLPPSGAIEYNLELFQQMYDDHKIRPFVHKISKSLKITKIFEEIVFMNSQKFVYQTKINHANISYLFSHFVDKVIKNQKKYDANDLVNIFLNTLINPNENYMHPKRSLLVSKSFGNISIDTLQFKAFFDHFAEEYTPKEKAQLTAICDRIIEDETRRRQGEFYTPTIWCNEAHKMISEQFGDDWKEKYVVWDPACGTGNLTRDYQFKELYCSTLNQSDIDIMEQAGYNPEAVKFCFDFLNEPAKKLPVGLKTAIKSGKPVIVFMNPPYGTANNAGTKDGDHKAGIAATKTAELMKKEGTWGAITQQLYAQFLCKMIKMNKQGNVNLAVFTTPLFLTGGSYKQFRSHFLESFTYKSGLLLNAGDFSNVSKTWGVSFTIWANRTQEKIVNEFILSMKNGSKMFYNLDNNLPASKWAREEIKGMKTYDAPQLGSGLTVKAKGRGTLIKDSLGYMVSVSNNVYKNQTDVFLVSSTSSMANGFSIIKENINKVIALFTARKTIKQNWINQKDEYMAPDTEHPDYQQWNNDCLVYSLFNTSSNQSSLRQIEYKDKLWDIQNQWFWMSSEEIKDLANENCNDGIYQDCRQFPEEKFVYNKIQETEFSEDAQELLDLTKELTIKSFKMRKIMQDEYPEYHLNCWDAGWYQIKKVLKAYFPDDLKNFNLKYKKFNDRMAEDVYTFGFLK